MTEMGRSLLMRNNFIEAFVRKMIPTKRISYSNEKEPRASPPSGLVMDLQFHDCHPTKWKTELPYDHSPLTYVRRTALPMMSARHLPLLVKLINSTFSSALSHNLYTAKGSNTSPKDPLYKISLDFNDTISREKAQQIAESLRGLREFRFQWKPFFERAPDPIELWRNRVNLYDREIVITGLDLESADKLKASSNLPVLKSEETLEEIYQFIETGDRLAEAGAYLQAHAYYLLAVNTLRYDMIPHGNIPQWTLQRRTRYTVRELTQPFPHIHFRLPQHIGLTLGVWRKLARVALQCGLMDKHRRWWDAIGGALASTDRGSPEQQVSILREHLRDVVEHGEVEMVMEAFVGSEEHPFQGLEEVQREFRHLVGNSEFGDYEDYFVPEMFDEDEVEEDIYISCLDFLLLN
ncbi:hypothetical protein HYALB_00001183 [Hymenoscyphus albidus]|uniref:Uncharacterized protein n=1 Tax=Hymenoscyphus albidus TaxID=595503 RepID=A0A9N9LGW7_9HELO|nr:hypothetical protein HYALB_00001183 [Hymenoscyphus albidus]